MNDIDHAVVVLFNVYRGPVPNTKYLHGTHDENGLPKKSYIDKRLPLFLDSTMRSLVNQRSRNFFLVFMYEHRSDFGNNLQEFLDNARKHLDFSVELAPIEPIDFTTLQGYNRNFWARRRTEEDAIQRGCRGRKWLYVTYLDGDDFLRDDYVEKVQRLSCAPAVQAIVPTLGYAFDSLSYRLRHFKRGRCVPFFTLRYQASRFFAGQRWEGGPGRHLHVDRVLRTIYVHDRIFAQHVHEHNDSTAFDTLIGVGSEVDEPARSSILRRFGWPCALQGLQAMEAISSGCNASVQTLTSSRRP